MGQIYYADLIYYYNTKYIKSEEIYKKVFKLDDSELDFFYCYDVLNVYPLFPSPISLALDTTDHNKLKITTQPNNNTMLDMVYKKKVDAKIREFEAIPLSEIKERNRNNMRKFFSYEIIDTLVANYNAEYVTVAWTKCYEILHWYQLVNKSTNNKFKYFGICEQPGAFVFAINHYVKTKTSREFDFVLQSLVDPSNRKIFVPQKDLYSQYMDRYDYGQTKTGDVTSMSNIKFYRKKYYDEYFDLITADCGLDCSNDFTLQETNLLNVITGQFILAMALASKTTNYFFKIFTIYENLMVDILRLASAYFETVFICRALTTKPDSGEVYIICKNFLHNKSDTDNLINDLTKWYDSVFTRGAKIGAIRLLDDDNSEFNHKLDKYNELLALRRLTSINLSYFRFKNNKYITTSTNVKSYVGKLANHYSEYFINNNRILFLPDVDHLVTAKIKSKWTANKLLDLQEQNTKSYREYVLSRSVEKLNDYSADFNFDQVLLDINFDQHFDYDAFVSYGMPTNIGNNKLYICRSGIKFDYYNFINTYYLTKTLAKLIKFRSLVFIKYTSQPKQSRHMKENYDKISEMLKIDRIYTHNIEREDFMSYTKSNKDDLIIASSFHKRNAEYTDEWIESLNMNICIEYWIHNFGHLIKLYKMIMKLKLKYRSVYITYNRNVRFFRIYLICVDNIKIINTKSDFNFDTKLNDILKKFIETTSAQRNLERAVTQIQCNTTDTFYEDYYNNVTNANMLHEMKNIYKSHNLILE